MDANPTIIPAATLVILRERRGHAPDLLMVERASAMRFAGGAMVFPGGRVDPADSALAALYPGDAVENAARIAAIRETIEEAGIAIGIGADFDAVAARAALARGETLGDALDGRRLDLDALVPFARWRPRLGVAPRVFDTHFFLARLPDDAHEPTADGGESVSLRWTSARAVLAEADAGRAHIIFPTRRNLERLALFDSFDDAVADARAHPVEAITPWLEERNGEPHLCIPADRGYPVTSQPARLALRG